MMQLIALPKPIIINCVSKMFYCRQNSMLYCPVCTTISLTANSIGGAPVGAKRDISPLLRGDKMDYFCVT